MGVLPRCVIVAAALAAAIVVAARDVATQGHPAPCRSRRGTLRASTSCGGGTRLSTGWCGPATSSSRPVALTACWPGARTSTLRST